jgi:hypothetical protein
MSDVEKLETIVGSQLAKKEADYNFELSLYFSAR